MGINRTMCYATLNEFEVTCTTEYRNIGRAANNVD